MVRVRGLLAIANGPGYLSDVSMLSGHCGPRGDGVFFFIDFSPVVFTLWPGDQMLPRMV